MTGFLGVLAAAVTVVALFWLLVRLPFPKKATSAKLASSFRGLQLFGLDGAYVWLRPVSGGHSLLFVRHGRDADQSRLILEFLGKAPGTESRNQFLADLRLQGVDATETSPLLRRSEWSLDVGPLNGIHSATCEAIARLALVATGHSLDEYCWSGFGGPKDNKRVNEYFGLNTKENGRHL